MAASTPVHTVIHLQMIFRMIQADYRDVRSIVLIGLFQKM